MKKFLVPVMFEACGWVPVVAENEEDLENKLKDARFVDRLPLPVDWEYLDGSYEVDFEGLAESVKNEEN